VTTWDAQWYWDIVLHGYPDSAVDAAGQPVQTSLAFFPLYPTVVRALTRVTGLGFDVVAPTLSLLLGAAAFLVLFRLLADVAGRTRALLGLAVLTCFVSAPILQTAYTESLALLLVAATLLLLRQRRYLWALLPVVLLGLTRNITVVLAPVILLHWFVAWRRAGAGAPVRHGRLAVLLTVSVLAAAEWPLLAGVVTGERDAYFTTMQAWPGYTSSVLHPPWLDMVASSGPVGWLLALAFVGLAAALLLRPAIRSWGPELWGWAAVYPAYIFAASGVTLSLLRYLLLAFPYVLVLAPHAPTAASRRLRLTVVVAACLLGLAGQWWWVSSVLVITRRENGFAYP
jgi:hypothetical protein